MQAETDRLLRLTATLPAERAVHVQHHLLTFQKFTLACEAAITAVNERDDHTLEGWARRTLDCIRDEACQTWHPMDDLHLLPAHTQDVLLTAAEQNPQLFFASRRLTPSEAWRRETREGLATGRLKMLSPWDCAELIALAGKSEPGLRTIRPREARTAYLLIQDTTLARIAEPIFYAARIRQPDGTERELRNGEEVECIFNPFAPDVLFIRSDKGRFLGVAPRATKIDPNDREATLRAWAEASSRRAERLAPVRETMAHRKQEITDRRDHNARVADLTRPFLPEEKTQHASLTAARARVSELLKQSRQNEPAPEY
jgi:hypothetical protein